MDQAESRIAAPQRPALVRRLRAHKSLGASILARTLADRRVLVRKAALAVAHAEDGRSAPPK